MLPPSLLEEPASSCKASVVLLSDFGKHAHNHHLQWWVIPFTVLKIKGHILVTTNPKTFVSVLQTLQWGYLSAHDLSLELGCSRCEGPPCPRARLWSNSLSQKWQTELMKGGACMNNSPFSLRWPSELWCSSWKHPFSEAHHCIFFSLQFSKQLVSVHICWAQIWISLDILWPLIAANNMNVSLHVPEVICKHRFLVCVADLL